LKVIKAVQVRDEASLSRIADYPVNDILLMLFMRWSAGEPVTPSVDPRSGSGTFPTPVWLAGGLTGKCRPGRAPVQPFAVDVASGVEDATPAKNMDKVASFRAAKHRP
jgi:phosphoribosylanthranilate isomerase